MASTTSAISLEQQEQFDDALHHLVNATRRPKADQQQQELRNTLSRLLSIGGNSNNNYVKTVVLALTHKRYHGLAPTAKLLGVTESAAGGLKSTGEGERLVYYTAFRYLLEQLIAITTEAESATVTATSHEQLQSALLALVRIAPLAGGSRDICQMIEDTVTLLVSRNPDVQTFRVLQTTLHGKDGHSLSQTVAVCVRALEAEIAANRSAALILQELIQLAAKTLDEDFAVVAADDMDGDNKATVGAMPSTMHIFVPHHERGRPAKRKTTPTISERHLSNSVAELLLWRRTDRAMATPAFVASYEKLLRPNARDDKESAKKAWTCLQTVIRKLRRELNAHARERGFMLSDQFVRDADRLASRHINAGKAGDLGRLAKLASKKGNTRVLSLIHLRNQKDPSKITRFSSVQELLGCCATKSDDAEVAALEREIFLARLQATIRHLRALVRTQNKSVVVASLENQSELNHAAAILVASALSDRLELAQKSSAPVAADAENASDVEETPATMVKLFLGGVERNLNSSDDLVALLEEVALGTTNKNEMDAPSYMDEDGAVTTKGIMNFMDRHLPDSQALLLITSADISLPGTVMQSLSDRGCSVHCHDAADDLSERLRRENAKAGDVTISLAWDTVDDLDLHVFVPGGQEIYYSNKTSRDGLCSLDVDMNGGGPQSKEPVENVFLGDLGQMKQAPLGHYKVVVQNYAYHTPSSGGRTPIPFRVVIDMNGVKQTIQGECKGTGKQSNVTVYEFDYEGRTIPFPSEEKNKTAFGTSNLVNLTASTGQTLDSIGQLVQVTQRHKHLDVVRTLVDEPPEEDAQDEAMDYLATAATPPRPRVVAQHGHLEVTSRDRINIQLAKLPRQFHDIVGETLGGPSLAELCAEDVARRMVADRVPVSELCSSGYPREIVDAVKAKMVLSDAM